MFDELGLIVDREAPPVRLPAGHVRQALALEIGEHLVEPQGEDRHGSAHALPRFFLR